MASQPSLSQRPQSELQAWPMPLAPMELAAISSNEKGPRRSSRREPRSTSSHRGSRTAHHPKSHRPVRAVPFSGVTRIASTHAGCGGMSSYGKRRTSRVLGCADSPPARIGGGALSHKTVRRILHGCPPNQGKGRAKTHTNECSSGIRFYWPSYRRPHNFQANSPSDF
jgi:hypothetical protein